ncbi:MAG: orotidine-5'-phosphate decarboxylase [Terriglobales bacterium]
MSTAPVISAVTKDRLIIALDVPNAVQAQRLVLSLGDAGTFYKVGLELFTAEGPSIVRNLVASGKKIFLDLKIHEIPNSAAGAIRSAAALGASMVTVHASGGLKMMQAASIAALAAPHRLTVLAVTVLTSLSEDDVRQIGYTANAGDQVLHLARLAKNAGCGGLVSSPQEVPQLRRELGSDLAIVTPGIRPLGSDIGDQARISTPAEALRAGASHLVVGRPINAADDPAAAAQAILAEMQEAR